MKTAVEFRRKRGTQKLENIENDLGWEEAYKLEPLV
jgi:hypothetical protein